MKKKCNVVFLGCTNGYGYAFSACNTKVEFMAKGLIELGDTCIIHNGPSGKPGSVIKQKRDIQGIGTVIDYAQKGPWYISSFRNYGTMLHDLKSLYQSNATNWVILEAPYLPFYYLELIAARKAGFKVAVISHEWLRTSRDRNVFLKWMKYLYSDIFGYCVDVILPISEYIINKIQKFNKPYLKVPIEADFSLEPSLTHKEPFFLYCVSAEYHRVILMVLKGFKKFCQLESNYKLILVLGGTQKAIDVVYQSVKELGLDGTVIIKHRVPYKELFHLYQTSSGLVVPLDPNYEQDEARFSQKIAEYLSSGSVIISNNVGEIKHYFKHLENILLDEFSTDGFYRLFRWIAQNPQEAIRLGHNGYRLGREFFDYKMCAKQLHDFLIRQQ